MDGGGSLALGTGIDEAADEGCAFILDHGGACGAVRRSGSAYCEPHHLLCHVPEGSARERRRLREAEVLAKAVGGRRGRPGRAPPDRFLRWLEKIARDLARSKCSCIVREDGE